MVSTSVIIPVFNDAIGLSRTIDSLQTQSTDDFEVIIVDNGSTDATLDVLDAVSKPEHVQVTFERDIQSSYAARNRGIDKANGSILCFLDADTWVGTDFIASITERISAQHIDYLGCRVEVVGSDTIASRYDMVTGFPVKRYIEQYGFAPTCSLVVSRSLIDQVGTFDGRLLSSGDVEFGQRVRAAGVDQEYASDIVVCHPARSSLRSLLAKHVRIGRGRTQLRRYYPDRFRWHPLTNPLLYLPPNPRRFYNTVEGEAQHNVELLHWYLTKYLLNLAQLKGSVHETFSPTRAHVTSGVNIEQPEPH